MRPPNPPDLGDFPFVRLAAFWALVAILAVMLGPRWVAAGYGVLTVVTLLVAVLLPRRLP